MRVRCMYAGGIVHRPQLIKDRIYLVDHYRHGCYYLNIDGQVYGYLQYRFLVEPDLKSYQVFFDTYNGINWPSS